MIYKCLAIAFLATASVAGAALAQTATNQVDSTTSATTHKDGEWRASKLAGVDVYNEANEKIGSINEVILDRSGKVANVILGVGGVLGLGEHYVAVAFDKLRWVDQPVTSTTASTTSAPANTPATTSAKRVGFNSCRQQMVLCAHVATMLEIEVTKNNLAGVNPK